MKDLDNLEIIKKIDESNMRELLLGFPEQCQKAYNLAVEKIRKSSILVPEIFGQAKNIVTAGMGGSAIGGDLVRSLYVNSCPVPIVVNRNYSIPGFVNQDTLFIAVSYSGNTEETLAAFQEAVKRHAKVVSISGGGILETDSKEKDVPHFTIPKRGIQPRCAFGYLFIPMAVLLSKLGFIPDVTSELEAAIKLLSDTASGLSPSTPVKDNQAKQIAQTLYDKLPVIYASQNYFDVVAMRWKGQFNENSKMMAFYNVIPEMNHNEIVGWGIPKDITHRCVVIVLSDDEDYKRIGKRIGIAKELIAEENIQIVTVQPRGSSPLAKALYLIYLGDFTSYYLAILNDEDPTPIERIDIFKAKLQALDKLSSLG